MRKKTALPRDRPRGRRFYSIIPRDESTADVYLFPDGEEQGLTLAVSGVEIWPGMEDDIRARYRAWCESAKPLEGRWV